MKKIITFDKKPIIISLFFLICICISFIIEISNFKIKQEKMQIQKKVNISYYSILNLIEKNSLDNAIETSLNVLKENMSYSSEISLLLADIYFKKKYFDLAEYYYNLSINLDRYNISAYTKLSNFYRRGRFFDYSLKVLDEAKKYIPSNHPLILNEYAEYYEIKQDYSKAIDFLKDYYYYTNQKEILFKIGLLYRKIEINHNPKITLKYVYILNKPEFNLYYNTFYVSPRPEYFYTSRNIYISFNDGKPKFMVLKKPVYSIIALNSSKKPVYQIYIKKKSDDLFLEYINNNGDINKVENIYKE